VGPDLVHHCLGDWPLVKRVRALSGNGLQGTCKFRIFQQCTDWQSLPLRGQEVLGHFRGVGNEFVGGDLTVQSAGHRKALASQLNSRLEQVMPRQFAMLLMGHFQCSEHPWHPDRTPAYLGIRKGDWLAICPEKHTGAGTCRGRLTTIKGLHPLAIPVQNKSTATNATGLGLYKCQYCLHGYCCINRRPAFSQHLLPGGGCQRVRCRCHVSGCVYRDHVGAKTRGYLGRRWQFGGFLLRRLLVTAPSHPQGQRCQTDHTGTIVFGKQGVNQNEFLLLIVVI